MYTHNFQGDLAKIHRWELEREAEKQRLAATLSPRRNVVRLALSKLALLLTNQGATIKHIELVEPGPKPITGSL